MCFDTKKYKNKKLELKNKLLNKQIKIKIVNNKKCLKK